MPLETMCAFISHPCDQIRVTIRKPSIQNQNVIFSPRVTLEYDWCPWKTTGHLFYTTLSCVYHFKRISEFKLEL